MSWKRNSQNKGSDRWRKPTDAEERNVLYEVTEIPIGSILVRTRRELNDVKVGELAASVAKIGLRTPITVCPVWGKKEEYVLVSGLHRLEAMKRLDAKTIPCLCMRGDKGTRRMWQISENLHRAQLTALEHDEQLAEWVQLFEQEQKVSGQKVQKSGNGRPKGGISEAARHLPVNGKTPDAKRKNTKRALTVASLDPHAKKAAKTEGLDDNRSALLKAAAAKGRKAQLAKIKELSAQRSKAKTKRSAKAVALSTKDKECLDGLLESWKRSEELVRAFVGAPDNVAEEFLTRIRQMRREAIAKDPKSWA